MSMFDITQDSEDARALTEAGWEEEHCGTVLLAWLSAHFKTYGTQQVNRRSRLFACASARRYWEHLVACDEQIATWLGPVLEKAERFADGQIDRAAFEPDARLMWRVLPRLAGRASAVLDVALHAFSATPFTERWEMAPDDPHAGWTDAEEFRAVQAVYATMLRDLFDNPFRPAIERLTCLPSEGGTVRLLAETIYRENTFAELPIVADALEDANCEETRVIEHLRRPGLHVRGCWALDLVRGVGEPKS